MAIAQPPISMMSRGLASETSGLSTAMPTQSPRAPWNPSHRPNDSAAITART